MTTTATDVHVEAEPSQKCAHPSCACILSEDRPFGKYCGEHCENAGELSELRCECGHDMCREEAGTPVR